MNLFLAPWRFAALSWSRHRSALLFLMAALFGGLAVFGARGYIAERVELEKSRLVSKQPMVEVVVARRDLERGEIVAPESMAVREVPADLLPGSAVRPERFDHHVGVRLAQPMHSGEPLLSSAIVGAEVGAFSARIRQGIRAMSVLVDEVNSVSGMLQPGDRIDLLFTVRPPVAPGQPPAQELTGTLMQDLVVLATGRQVRAGADDAPGPARHFTAITVEVSPTQAQQLIVAQRTGKLTAMLRHPDDRQPLRAKALDLNALLGIAPPGAAHAAVPDSGPEIIVGGRGTLVSLPIPARVPLGGPLGGPLVGRWDEAAVAASVPVGTSSDAASAPAVAAQGIAWALRQPGPNPGSPAGNEVQPASPR